MDINFLKILNNSVIIHKMYSLFTTSITKYFSILNKVDSYCYVTCNITDLLPCIV